MVAWKLEHAAQESVVAARSVGFAAEVASGGKDGAGRSGGLLSVLSLDPMAGLDPAVREITQARQLAERALFVAQRMPKLIRWQTEMYTIEALDLPATRQMVANTTQITASIEKVTAVVEKLPEKLTKEREELVKILENQEKTLKPLVTEVRQTVEAGNELSKSLNVTLKTLDEFIARVSPPGPKDPNAEPFRIQDYVKAAAQAEATIRQATELIASLDKTLASDPVKKISEQVAPVVKQGEAAARDLVDHVFHQALILVGVILAAALAYRFVASRWVGPRQAK
jgi:small-conductance mechanosensitive channel